MAKDNPTVRVTARCRGEGLGYLVFETDAETPLGVRAESAKGQALPVLLLPFESRDSWVVVLPLIAEDVRVSVMSGEQELASLTFADLLSKLESRALTLARPAVASTLRGIERRRGAGMTRVSICEVWPARDGTVVWRVRVAYPTDDADSACTLSLFDDHAQAIDACVFVMEDHLVPSERDGHANERLVTFSCAMSDAIRSFFAVAALGDGKEVGFDGMNAPRATALIDDARRRVEGAACDPAYAAWFERHKVTSAELARQRRSCAALAAREHPLVSLVLVAYRTHPPYLEAALASVTEQSYDRWELVVVNASGDCPEVDAVLGAVEDERIHVIEVENRSIAENTNVGIRATQGDYVAFMDHDDVLEPDCLWCFVATIRAVPQVDLLYCDEDRLVEGRVHAPAFKTFPNLGKLYGHNYITHLLMVSRYALERTERSGAEVSGAQDFDLTLKAFEVAREVAHVPRVLYHWREHELSTAGGADQKPYAHEAGRRALAAHLERRGIAATVSDGTLSCTYRVRFSLPDAVPKASVVIPTRDHAGLLRTCVESILERTTYPDFEVVLVENGSVEDATFALYDELCARDARVRVVVWEPREPGAFNYSALVNYGARHAAGALLVLLNNDTEVLEPAWLEEMAGCLMRPEVGVVGAKLLFEDGLVQHVGMVANPNGDFCHVCQNADGDALGPAFAVAMPGDYAMVTGACQMVSRALFDELGGYDEGLAVGFNDGDFCLRARELGYTATVASGARLHHREFSSRGREAADLRLRARYLAEKGRMLERHAAFFAAGDPALNPNLDGFKTFFELGS